MDARPTVEARAEITKEFGVDPVLPHSLGEALRPPPPRADERGIPDGEASESPQETAEEADTPLMLGVSRGYAIPLTLPDRVPAAASGPSVAPVDREGIEGRDPAGRFEPVVEEVLAGGEVRGVTVRVAAALRPREAEPSRTHVVGGRLISLLLRLRDGEAGHADDAVLQGVESATLVRAVHLSVAVVPPRVNLLVGARTAVPSHVAGVDTPVNAARPEVRSVPRILVPRPRRPA